MSKDPYQYFRTEARELVESLTQGALDLEKGRGEKDLVSRLLRYAHTLKGAARIVKQLRISERSHAIEEILAPYRQDSAGISSDDVRQILSHVDAIAAELAGLQAPSTEDARAAMTARAGPSNEGLESLRINAAEMDALLRNMAALRIHLSALEHQANALGSLVHKTAKADGNWPLKDVHQAIQTSLDRTRRELGQLYEQGSEMRLVPANSVFSALERTVRDAADASGKCATFVAAGGNTRLDAHALSLLRNALMHLVRNAVAHGIETQSERLTAGKPLAGRVQLRVERRSDRAVFTCTDDGRGIDLGRVRQVLLSKGVVTPAEAGQLDSDAAVAVLLRGGISTMRSVTEQAGRGIGLDVVRQAVTSLKGSATVRSEPGSGTTIEISVPVSIESLEVLYVGTGGTIAAIPFQAVRQALRLKGEDLARSARGDSILWEGQAVPFASLVGILSSRIAPTESHRGLTALILDGGSAVAAVGVDHVLGRERVVVRTLPAVLGVVPAVAGAFLDSEGDPQLVLDPAGIVERVRSGGHRIAPASPPVRPPVLVVDDSLTTRMLEQGILEAAGYDVDTAASGEEALEKARQRRYGVFVVDVEMPGISGFEFIEAARVDSRLSHVPSIVVTSRDSEQDRARGQRVEVKAYIVKSRFDEELLLGTIRRLIG